MIPSDPKKEQMTVEEHSGDASSASGSVLDPSQSSGDVESTTGSQTTGTGDHDLRRKILNEDDRNVKRARFLVVIAFLLCASAVTTAVFLFTKQSNQVSFEADVSVPRESYDRLAASQNFTDE
jgi:hypothetical protein